MAIVQSVLLYGSETWVLSTVALARLEGFHLCTAYWMARKYVPCWEPHHWWIYPPPDKVLEECGMHTIQHYINVLRQTIAKYVGLQHLCGMPGGRSNMLFGAQVLVVGAENVIERRLMQLDLAIKPF